MAIIESITSGPRIATESILVALRQDLRQLMTKFKELAEGKSSTFSIRILLKILLNNSHRPILKSNHRMSASIIASRIVRQSRHNRQGRSLVK